MSEPVVVHVPERQRYELREGDDVLGVSDYRPAGDSVIVAHTEVQEGQEGSGHGSRLIAGMLEQIRASGKTVIPTCPFTAAYIQRHPEWIPTVDPSLRRQFGAG